MDKKSTAVALCDPNVLVEVDYLEKAGLFGKGKIDFRELPPLEKGVDDVANNLSDDNLPVHGLGKVIGGWRILLYVFFFGSFSA